MQQKDNQKAKRVSKET